MSTTELTVVKVEVQTEGKTLLKALKVPVQLTVNELMAHVARKCAVQKAQDHGMFRPAENGQGGLWLNPTQQIGQLHLSPDTALEFRRVVRPLKFRTQDGAKRTILIDESLSVGKLLEKVCRKLGINEYLEYGFAYPEVEGERGFLNVVYSLPEQGVTASDVLTFKKRFFATDDQVDERDPASLHHVYVDAQTAIINGTYPCTIDEAIEFAALQCQIQFGDYQEGVIGVGVLRVRDFLPLKYCDVIDMEERILLAYRNMKDQHYSEHFAKFRYVQICRSLKTYGITMFMVKEPRASGRLVEVLLGISRNRILRINPVNIETISRFKITQLARWSCSKNHLTLDFGRYAKTLYKVETKEGDRISQLLSGYIEIILAKAAEAKKEKEEEEEMEEQVMVEEHVTQAKPKAGEVVMPEYEPIPHSDEDIELFIQAYGGTTDLAGLNQEEREEACKNTLTRLTGALGTAVAGAIVAGVVPSADAFRREIVVERVGEFDMAFAAVQKCLGECSISDLDDYNGVVGAMAKLGLAVREFSATAVSLAGDPKTDLKSVNALLNLGQRIGGDMTTILSLSGALTPGDIETQTEIIRLTNAVISATSALIVHSKDLATRVQNDSEKWGKVVNGIKLLGKATQQIKPVAVAVSSTISQEESVEAITAAITNVQEASSHLVNTTTTETELEAASADATQLTTEMKTVTKACTALLACCNPHSCEAAIIEITRALAAMDQGTLVSASADFKDARAHLRDGCAAISASISRMVDAATSAQAARRAGPIAADAAQGVTATLASACAMVTAVGGADVDADVAAVAKCAKAVAIACGKLVGAAKSAAAMPEGDRAMAAPIVQAGVSGVDKNVSKLLSTVSAVKPPKQRDLAAGIERLAATVLVIDNALVDASLGMLTGEPDGEFGDTLPFFRSTLAQLTQLVESAGSAGDVERLTDITTNAAEAAERFIDHGIELSANITTASADGSATLQHNVLGHIKEVIEAVVHVCEASQRVVTASAGASGDSGSAGASNSATAAAGAAFADACTHLGNTIAEVERIMEGGGETADPLALLLAALGLLDDDAAIAAAAAAAAENNTTFETLRGTDMPAAVRQVAEAVLRVSQVAKAEPTELPAALMTLATAYECLVVNTQTAVALGDRRTSTLISTAARGLGGAIIRVVELAREVASDGADFAAQQSLSAATRDTSALVSKFIGTVKHGRAASSAERVPGCAAALTSLDASATEINALLLAVSTGSLEAAPADTTLSDAHVELNTTTTALLAALPPVLAAADANSTDALGDACGDAASRMPALVTALKLVLPLLSNPMAQASLLGAATDLATALSGLVSVAPDAAAAGDADTTLTEDLSQASCQAIPSALSLVLRSALTLLDADVGPDDVTASADDVVAAAQAVASSSAALVACAGDGYEVVAAAGTAASSAAGVLLTQCAAAVTSAPPDLRTQLLDAAREVGNGVLDLFSTLHGVYEGRSMGETDAALRLSDASARVASTVVNVAAAAEALKAGDDWVDYSDPNAVAEHELLQAAASIEAAALKLSQLQPRREVGVDHDLVFEEQIVEAAKAIAACTKALLQSARATQKEIVDAGKHREEGAEVYNANPHWQEGLVSAAKSVAGATNELCEAANAVVVEGETQLARLIAATKTVSSSTAHLVMAAQVKTSVKYSTQDRLKAAAKAVKAAASKLADAALTHVREEDDSASVAMPSSAVGAQAALVQQRQAVAEMELKLEKERKRLLALQKQQYNN